MSTENLSLLNHLPRLAMFPRIAAAARATAATPLRITQRAIQRQMTTSSLRRSASKSTSIAVKAAVLVSIPTAAFFWNATPARAASSKSAYDLPFSSSSSRSPACTLSLVVGDITQWHGDAIVNAAKSSLMGGGGIDGAIHRAAGPGLLEACKKVPTVDGSSDVRCPTGAAVMTRGPFGSNLAATSVIHTVGPDMRIASMRLEGPQLLRSAYSNSLRVADEHQCTTVALPAISAGIFAYPLNDAAAIAVDSCVEFTRSEQRRHVKEITFVLFDEKTQSAFRQAVEQHPNCKPSH
jgi:O-acetyl-ADP-ribose deacetylase (regulator of RNase III)